jgi:hypothetical protein
MAIQEQAVTVTFAGGVETRQDPKQVPPTKLLDLQNAVFARDTTIVKRNGYRALGGFVDGTPGVGFANARGLAQRGTELLAFTDARAYSYRPSSDTWNDTGAVASVVATDEAIARTGTTQTQPDLALNAGATLAAWEDNRGGVWYALVETDTGRELIAPTQADALGQRPRCLAVGRVLHLIWAKPTANRLYIIVVNPATSAAGAAAIFTDDLDGANPSFDAEGLPADAGDGTSPGVIAWVTTGGGYRIAYVHPSGVIGSPATGLPTAAAFADLVPGAIAVAYAPASSTGVIAVAFVTGIAAAVGVPWVRFVNAAALSVVVGGADHLVLSAATSASGWGRLTGAFTTSNSGDAWSFAAELQGATVDTNAVYVGTVTAIASTAVLGTVSTIRGHVLTSRAFLDGASGSPGAGTAIAGDVYAIVAHPVLYYPYFAAIRLSAPNGAATPIAARLLPGQAVGAPTRAHLSSVPPIDQAVDATGLGATYTARRHLVPLGYRIQLASSAGNQFGEQGIRAVTLDFANAAAWKSAELGAGLYLAGAAPLHYDGDRWAEADFHAAPDTASGVIATTPAGGGSMTSSATYLYRCWYEEIDGAGEIHPGPVTVGTTVTMGGADTQVTLTIPTLRLTQRRRVRIGVARSPANQTGGIDATPFYRVTSTDPAATGANGFLLNDPTVDTVTFVDRLSDTTLIAREPLYTNGGVSNNAPASWRGSVIAGGKARLFWTDSSDPHLVRFSQELRDDTGMEAPAELSVRIDPYGGPITGLGILDDTVVVFKERAIYIFGGAGPAAAPALDPQAGFSPPQLVTSDCGCKAADSIGLTPDGLIFQSSKGIMLLDRTRQLQTIGTPVAAYNAQTITRTVLLPDRPYVMMTAADADGRTLLYDYERRQWSTFTNHLGVDAAVVDGALYYLRTDARVFVETIGSYQDDNLHVPMRIETAWVKMVPYLQAWHQFWYASFIGAYRSAHTLRVRLKIDYQDAWVGPFDLDVDTNYDPSLYGVGTYGVGAYGGSLTEGAPYQRRIHVGLRAQAIAFRIEDIEADGAYGAAFELSELLLTGGILRQSAPLGATRSS